MVTDLRKHFGNFLQNKTLLPPDLAVDNYLKEVIKIVLKNHAYRYLNYS